MSTQRKTIVVVEDEESVLSVTVRLLDRAGYDVLAFSHPHAARVRPFFARRRLMVGSPFQKTLK